VRSAVETLGERAGHWCFVSSISVYADFATPGQRADTAPLLGAAGPDDDDFAPDTYGPRKVACEQALPPKSFIVRPGLVIGPEDATNRFAYWASRLERGGEILAPGNPDDSVQWVDVRDLAAWIVQAAETRLGGVYDGICAPVTRLEMLTSMGYDPQLTWVPQDFLAEQGVEMWMGERALPVWVNLPEFAGFLAHDPTTALEAGLRIRPLAETTRDTLAWLASSPEIKRTSGITPDDERALLAEWHSRRTT
jgi:nucleoside-diphosphate-sugar epimerase